MKKTLMVSVLGLLYFLANAQKTVYIPNDFNQSGSDNYCNENGNNGTISSIDDMQDDDEIFSQNRSYETDNIVCFWEAGFGTDPTAMVDPTNTSSTFDLTSYMDKCEEIFDHHVNTLAATYSDGENLNKYKFIFLLYYTTDWTAYGGGYDYVIGAMWLNPAPMGVNSTAVYPYFTLSHELFHSMSYQVYSDRPDDDHNGFQAELNGPVWERSANNAATDMYPEVDNDFARFMFNEHSHFMHTRKHYTTSFFLENLKQTYGKTALGLLWQENLLGEHPMQTATRIFFDDSQAALNDFIGETAMKNITWDYEEGTNAAYFATLTDSYNYDTDSKSNLDEWNPIMKKHRTILRAIDYDKRHFAVQDCQAPQDYGYNAIRIYPESTEDDGSAEVVMRFRGHTDADEDKNPGWRWGFVAVQNDGTPRYGTLYSDTSRTVSFTMESTDDELWLVVAGTPTLHNSAHNYGWEAGFPKYYRYPYEVRFQNAVPEGYQDDYEGEKSNGAAHSNGGGWVASTATVASTAYVGPNAKVLGYATVSDNAQILDFAVVKGSASISDNAVVKENAMVFSNAKVYGDAIIAGCSRVFNNSYIYGNAFVTDNAYVINTTMYGNAIACGNLWQRDNTCTLNGTCVAGGDDEYAGDAADGTESSGTYLQWPESSNNDRERLDGLGDLSTTDIETLRDNWNDISTRLSILNNSISSSTSNPNYDINTVYAIYDTDTEMDFGDILDESVMNIINQGTQLSIIGTIPDGTTYIIYNEAGIEVSSGEITEAMTLGAPSDEGMYIVRIYSDGEEYCEIIQN